MGTAAHNGKRLDEMENGHWVRVLLSKADTINLDRFTPAARIAPSLAYLIFPVIRDTFFRESGTTLDSFVRCEKTSEGGILGQSEFPG